MGDTLTRASELEAYTLTDEGTYYAYQSKLDLRVLVKGDGKLFNQYSVIPINPGNCKDAKYDLATKFSNWMAGAEAQKLIGDFRLLNKQLFTPNAK